MLWRLLKWRVSVMLWRLLKWRVSVMLWRLLKWRVIMMLWQLLKWRVCAGRSERQGRGHGRGRGPQGEAGQMRERQRHGGKVVNDARIPCADAASHVKTACSAFTLGYLASIQSLCDCPQHLIALCLNCSVTTPRRHRDDAVACRCPCRHVTFAAEPLPAAEEEVPDPEEADLVYRGGDGAGEPGLAQSESAKSESAQSESAKSESAKSESAQSESGDAADKRSSLPRFFPGAL
jgi:hypothetical protein